MHVPAGEVCRGSHIDTMHCMVASAAVMHLDPFSDSSSAVRAGRSLGNTKPPQLMTNLTRCTLPTHFTGILVLLQSTANNMQSSLRALNRLVELYENPSHGSCFPCDGFS